MLKVSNRHHRLHVKAPWLALMIGAFVGNAHAFSFDTSPDWKVNLDNTVQYTAGWRMQKRDPALANHFAYQSGDAKFSAGDMVTNRIQDLIEFQGIYKDNMGFRVSGSIWKDFAYNDNAKSVAPFSSAYSGDTYSNYTKRYFMQGSEFLDAFVFLNTDIGGTPVYTKAGRLSQYWGNAFFFGFSNIAYSQQPIDYVKGFTQPGSEVKELFLPRKQLLLSADLTQDLSVAAQYFLEYRPNRYPESGTYLGFFDPLFSGPDHFTVGPTTFPTKGIVEPPNRNGNWGAKVAWSPAWAGGDMGFYYRVFDEVDPTLVQLALDPNSPIGVAIQSPANQKAKLWGFSYEKSFGLFSTAFEINQRWNTALKSTPFNVLPLGGSAALGRITNVIGNTFVQLGTNPLWDSGILLAEFSYTHLNSVSKNSDMYFGEGHACSATGTNPTATWRDGCATKNSLAVAFLFDPQWLQVWPGIDLDMPASYTFGVHGNPAYNASAFYAQQVNLYSIGVKATYHSASSLSLQYNGYNWRTADRAGGVYTGQNGFGGNGAVGINDRGWLELQAKTSF